MSILFRSFCIFLTLHILTAGAFAQSPEKMSYQAIIRDATGALVKSAPVGVRFSILAYTATGPTMYSETQNITTNTNGLLTAEIGSGTIVSGSFSGIDWGMARYFLKTETDPSGGSSYTISGTTQLLSVPYALYAKSSASLNPSSANAWLLSGNTNTKRGVNFIGTTDTVPLSFRVNNAPSGIIDSIYMNTALGFGALRVVSPSFSGGAGTATTNTAIGFNSLTATVDGPGNTAIGAGTLTRNIKGGANTAIGASALFNNINGNDNTAIGANALDMHRKGGNNTVAGIMAMHNDTSGGENTAIGATVMYYNRNGIGNTAIGTSALYNNTTGSYNTVVGAGGFLFNGSGSYNTSVGYGTNLTADIFSNSSAFGADAIIGASNQIRLGSGTVTSVEGPVAYSYPSDARFKSNIKTNIPGLEFIRRLKPVSYTFDTKRFDQHMMQTLPDSLWQQRQAHIDYAASSAIVHTGFLAQDIEQACKELNYDFDGLHAPDPTNRADHYSIAYSQFIMPLVKAVQEQQVLIEKLEKRIAELEAKK